MQAKLAYGGGWTVNTYRIAVMFFTFSPYRTTEWLPKFDSHA